MLKKREKYILILIVAFTTMAFGLKCLLTTEITFYDEMSYIATALRFCKGDAMLVDDWAPMQLNGFLLMPIVGTYYYAVESMDGIVLFLRIIYLLMKLIIATFALWRFKNFGESNVNIGYILLGIAFYYIATPYNIDTLSYNTIPISMMFLIMVIILTHKKSNVDWILCGIFLAIAILGHPFILLVYIALTMFLLTSIFVKRRKKILVKKELLSMWFWITCGSAIMALLFSCFIFSRASLDEIVCNLPYIFQEPDHDSGIIEKVSNFAKDVFWDFKFITIINVIDIFILLCLKKKIRGISIACLITSCFYILLLKSPFIENLIYIPFLWFGIEQILINKSNKKYVYLFMMILLSVFGIYLGTNTRILSTSAAMCNFASLACFTMREERSSNEKKNKYINIITLTIMLIVTFILRLFIVWHSWYKVSDFKYYIDKGPLKGTYAGEEVWNDYYTVINDLSSIEYEEEDIFFCGTYTPLSYLYTNMEYGTMGVAFFFLDYDRIDAYWNMHPKKIPDIIYYLEREYTEEEEKFIQSLNQYYEVICREDRLIAIKK